MEVLEVVEEGSPSSRAMFEPRPQPLLRGALRGALSELVHLEELLVLDVGRVVLVRVTTLVVQLECA